MSRLDYIIRVLLYVVISLLTSISAERLAHASNVDTWIAAGLACALTLRAFVDKSTSQRDDAKQVERSNASSAQPQQNLTNGT